MLSRSIVPLAASLLLLATAVPCQGERLFHAAGEPKQFVKIEGAGHNNWLTEPYLKELNRLLARLSSQPK